MSNLLDVRNDIVVSSLNKSKEQTSIADIPVHNEARLVFCTVNMIIRNIIADHSKIWLPKPLLLPIYCENVLKDEFHSSNQNII